jgi:hypothetical protein
MAAFMCRSLLEDAALELTACGSPMLVWWRGGVALVKKDSGDGVLQR